MPYHCSPFHLHLSLRTVSSSKWRQHPAAAGSSFSSPRSARFPSPPMPPPCIAAAAGGGASRMDATTAATPGDGGDDDAKVQLR